MRLEYEGDYKTITVDDDVIKIIIKNGKYQVWHNKTKIKEYAKIPDADKKANEIAEPLIEVYLKKEHNIKIRKGD
jgi:hypothetical protein